MPETRHIEWQDAGASRWPERPLLDAQGIANLQRCNYFKDHVGSTITREDDRIEPSAILKEIVRMTLTTTEEIYEQIVKPLPAAERLRLIGKIVNDLSIQAIEGNLPELHNWMSLRGIAPNLLEGEDAQTWVSRTRRESDEDRERQWRPE